MLGGIFAFVGGARGINAPVFFPIREFSVQSGMRYRLWAEWFFLFGALNFIMVAVQFRSRKYGRSAILASVQRIVYLADVVELVDTLS